MHNLSVYHPFAHNGFDELIRGFFRPVRVEKAAAPIRMDVVETDAAYVVKAEIPGVGKDEIQVAIDGDVVTIGAEVKRENETKDGERILRAERYSGSVHRAFTLPVEIDEAASTAKYENGVLELTLIKKPAAAGRKITIQ
jgi:HSP20 family protein